MPSMNPSAAFEGVSGSIIVSVTAFTIVFAVLLGLTAVIYAIKIVSGNNAGAEGKAPAAPATAPQPVPVPAAPVASVPHAAGADTKVVAAITAALLAATGGRGRVLSVVPERARDRGERWTRTWRTAGLIEQVGNRLSRPWKH